ncbi:hypothetical protein KA005_56305 [bacterium]|nr:hypothetical protein [bacterium]
MIILKKTWPNFRFPMGVAFFRQGKSDPLHSKALTPPGVWFEIGNWKLEIWEVGYLQTGRIVIRYGLVRL